MPAPRDDNGKLISTVGWGPTQTVAVSGTSAQSTATLPTCNCVRLVANTDCHVSLGSNPTATTSMPFLPAGVVEFVALPGPGHKVAVLQNASAGTLWVTEVG